MVRQCLQSNCLCAQVNGVDLSDASPAEALKVFASAHDPILIEVKRRPNPQSKSIQTDETSSTTSTTSARNALWQTLPSEVLHGLMLQEDDEESHHEPVYQVIKSLFRTRAIC